MTPRNSRGFLSAKSKTASEVDSVFFRAWSLRPVLRSTRTSETVQSTGISPKTSLEGSSSNGAISKPQRRVNRPEHRRFRSSAAVERLSDQTALIAGSPEGWDPEHQFFEGPSLQRRDSHESLGSASDDPHLTPNAAPFRKLVRLSGQSITPPAVKDPKPSRKAKDAIKWHIGTSGHSFELAIKRKPRVDDAQKEVESFLEQSPSMTGTPITPVDTPKAATLGQRHGVSQNRSPGLGLRNSLANTVRGFGRSTPILPPKPSATSRPNQRKVGVKLDPNNPRKAGLSPTRSLTGHLLQRASSVLKDFTDRKMSPPSPASSNLSIAASYSRNKHLSALYRGHSVSSSLGNMPATKGPLMTPATPDSGLMYVGSDSQQYYRVEISEPGGPTYLPSEARRIGTPPLPGEKGRQRGFFFEYTAPSNEGNTPYTGSSPRLKGRGSPGGDWYQIQLEAEEARDAAMSFELNVPDHLPSSPLCPKHPKYKSGGKGICVYHGRNRDLDEDG